MNINFHFLLKKIKNWIVPIVGVFLYFILILYLRLLLLKKDGNIYEILIKDFIFNLPVLLVNIILIYWGVRFLNKHFFEKMILKFLLELIYICIITSFLVIIMGSVILMTQNYHGDFNLKNHISLFGDTFVMALLTGVFTLTILETHYQHKISKQKKLDLEAVQQENLTLKYIQLKNQINPHFLFNSLNILTALTQIDQNKAVEFIQKLSDIYRYVLFQDQKDIVSLAEEYSFIQSFIDILNTRFQGGLQIDISIKNTSLKKNIIPMTLQLLIENAVKHNIVDTQTPLSISIKSNDTQIEVSNNLNPKILVQKNHKIGLDSIIKRYRILDKNAEVTITQTDNHFIVKIPLL